MKTIDGCVNKSTIDEEPLKKVAPCAMVALTAAVAEGPMLALWFKVFGGGVVGEAAAVSSPSSPSSAVEVVSLKDTKPSSGPLGRSKLSKSTSLHKLSFILVAVTCCKNYIH
jgi:hypothetical protein